MRHHKKSIILFFIAFFFGFFVHLILFPNFFCANNFFTVKKLVPPVQKTNSVQKDDFITYVNYDGNNFIPNQVTIKRGNYLAITNQSKDTLMWLFSDNSILNTERGYALSERLQVLLPKDGVFQVINKLIPDAQLIVQVK